MTTLERKISKMSSVQISNKLDNGTFEKEEIIVALQRLEKRNVDTSKWMRKGNDRPAVGTKSEKIYDLITGTNLSSYKIAKELNTYVSVVLNVANRYGVHRFNKA